MPIVLLAVMMLGVFSFYFHQYRQTQIQMSSTIGKFYNALCVAEAGVAVAVTEMATNFEWKTHASGGAPGATQFTGPIKHDNAVKGGGVLSGLAGTVGTYSGKVGSLGEFKVRVGLEQVAGDNPATKTANEQFMFYRIESIGRYGDTYQKVTAVLKKRILSEEFLLFDNDFLDMVLGVGSSAEGDNVFSVGSLYGRRFVYLGTIESNKPKLSFRDVSNISTAGELYVWDNHVTLNNRPLTPDGNSSTRDFKLNNAGALVPLGSGSFWGDFVVAGKPNDDFAKNSLDVLKDGDNGGKLEVLNFEEIFPNFAARAAASGLVVNAGSGVGRPDPEFENPYPTVGKPKDLVHIDFGDMGDGDPALGAALPASFNGILYATVPLRIRGCPDRDMVIVSDEDIYICGDFNQSAKVIQAYKDENLIDYEVNPLTGKGYFAEDKEFRVNNPTEKHGLYRNRCKVISKGKVWYDYTRPDFVYRNELKGLIEFELARLLAGEAKAFDAIQDIAGTKNLVPASANDLLNHYRIEAAKSDDELLAMTKSVALMQYLCAKPAGGRTQQNAAPRTPSIYAKAYGETTQAAEDFLKAKRTVKEPSGDEEKNFLDMARDGRLTPAERTALVEALFDGLTASVEADGESSAVWDMPARLFDLTKPGAPYSQFGGSMGTLDQRKKDKLMIPEFTINAKIITGDTRNGLWKIGKTSRAIYNEIGNPHPDWPRPRAAGYYRYVPATGALLRLLGGEIHLRLNKREPVTDGSVYQPHIRKKVFDIELMGFEDETAIPSYSVVSFTHTKVDKTEFAGF